MLTPLYISENAPRAIRGGLTGFYQLFIACGTMLAFWTNYGSLLHLKGDSTYIVPLIVQATPAVLLLVCMLLNSESPRFLARADRWEDASKVLTRIRQLDRSHPYIQAELTDISEQLEHERMLIGGAKFKDLMKEMWLIPGNRKRALISIGLMVCQQMTGTNAGESLSAQASVVFLTRCLQSTTTRRKSSSRSELRKQKRACSPPASTA